MIDSGRAMAVTSVAPQIAQEHEHHDDREHRALDQRLHRRVIIPELIVDLRVDLGEGHVRVFGLNLLKPLGDQLIHRHVARALGARDAEGDDRLVEEAREGARLGRPVGDGRNLVEPHLPAAGQRDRQRCEIRDAAGARQACGSPAPGRRSRRVRRRDRHCLARTCSLTAAAVTPSASSFSGSSETRISRSTPPKRFTSPTPLMLCNSRATVSSMNHDSFSVVMPGAEAA